MCTNKLLSMPVGRDYRSRYKKSFKEGDKSLNKTIKKQKRRKRDVKKWRGNVYMKNLECEKNTP